MIRAFPRGCLTGESSPAERLTGGFSSVFPPPVTGQAAGFYSYRSSEAVVLKATRKEVVFKKTTVLLGLIMKVCLVKAMFFPVVVYGCESWTVKKAEH